MGDDAYDRVVAAGDRAVTGPAAVVTADRFTDDDGGGGGGGGGGSAAAPPAALPDPPVPIVIAVDPNLTPERTLQARLEQVRDFQDGKARPFRNLRMALVDLTDSVRAPVYAGVNDERQTHVDSLAKVGIMYAAYQLRDMVQQAAIQLRDEKKEQVLPRIEQAWRPYWEQQFPDRKGDFPRLDRMFVVNLEGPDRWKVRFHSLALTQPELKAIHAAGTGEKQDFESRLELMMRWSDNNAARGIETDLGFQCMNALLRDGGFFEASRGGGLWLSKRYEANVYWGRDPVGGGTVQGGTARAVADLLTLVVQDRFVRAGVSAEVGRIMQSAGSAFGIASWMAEAIMAAPDPQAPMPASGPRPTRQLDFYLDKVGVVKQLSDCLIARRTTFDGRHLMYVAVILGAPDLPTMQRAAVALDDCILAQHPPPPPPSP